MLDLEISSSADWKKFRDPQFKFDTILDPMIFRTADVFLRGMAEAERAGKADATWRAISQNLGALFTFFDNIMLCERLPLIDYGYTFDRHLGFGATATDELPILKLCNQNEKLLYNVHVDGEAYRKTREAALHLMAKHAPVPDDLRSEVNAELSAFDYDWKPIVPVEGPVSEESRLLQAFILNGILFGAYAQATASDHVIQPKRSRLLLSLSLPPTPSVRSGYEDALFSRLMEIANDAPGGVPRTIETSVPTFLPYLLNSGAQSPRELLHRALQLRRESMVNEYRHWWADLRLEWNKGRHSITRTKEVETLVASLQRRLHPEDKPINFTISLTDVSVEREVFLNRIWGWVLEQLPGTRYRKLLSRLVLAQREYVQVDRHLEEIWNKG